MSALAVAPSPGDLATTGSSRANPSMSDGTAFASQLQSASDSTQTDATTADDAAQSQTTAPVGTQAPAATTPTPLHASGHEKHGRAKSAGTTASGTVPVAVPVLATAVAVPLAGVATQEAPAVIVASSGVVSPASASSAAAVAPAAATALPDSAVAGSAATAPGSAAVSAPAAAASSQAPSAPLPQAKALEAAAQTDVAGTPATQTPAQTPASSSLPVVAATAAPTPTPTTAARPSLPVRVSQTSRSNVRVAGQPAQGTAADAQATPTAAATIVSAAQPIGSAGAAGSATDSPHEAARSDASATASFAPIAAAAPVVATTTQAAASVASAPPQAQTLTDQLSQPILNLRAAGAGTHVLTITVTPDSLGPVTVRAHVTADNIRVELTPTTDHGRDALGSILPDLRRDLSQGGMNAALTMTPQNTDAGAAANQGGWGGGDSSSREARPDYGSSPRESGQADKRPSPRTAIVAGTAVLDVLA